MFLFNFILIMIFLTILIVHSLSIIQMLYCLLYMLINVMCYLQNIGIVQQVDLIIVYILFSSIV